jgi:hypothetical protein
MLSALISGRESRGGLKLPPLAERSSVIDMSVFSLPGRVCSAKSQMQGGRQNRPCTSGIQLAELKRSSRTPDRKKSHKIDRVCPGPIDSPPLIDIRGPDCSERRSETKRSPQEQENLHLVPWLRSAEHIPRPVSRRPNSSFNLDGSTVPGRAASRDSAGGSGQRRAFWKQLQQSMANPSANDSETLRPSPKQLLHLPPDLG